MPWIEVVEKDETDAICPNCSGSIREAFPSLDHHAMRCLHCGRRLIAFTATRKSFVIDIENAPAELRQFLAWSQTALDELEFVSLMLTLEDLFTPSASST